MVDSHIGAYKVIREIAEDRLGHVFEAIDSARNKRVIIKSLRPEANRPEVVSRLYSEAETLALLNHPHIARLFGFIRANDKFHLVMEFVEGQSLRSMLKEKGRLDPNLALAIFRQIITAVKFAHELGVVHSDLKPSNIMVSSFAQIKVLDFVIAPILGDLDIANYSINSAPYMAPERNGREPVDARSDIYSLGVLLYESIVGRLPFTGKTQEEAQRAACKSTLLPPSLVISDCPKWLDAFLLRALAPSPGDRFQSIAAMSQAMGVAVPDWSGRISSKPARERITSRVQRISFVPSILTAGANRMTASLANRLDSAASIARQKQASATGALHRSMAAVNPWVWTKRSASRISAWTRTARLELICVTTPARRISQGVRERFAGFPDNNWKRYVVLASLLASVMIETFIFGGANTFLNPDFNVIPTLHRNGAAQSILEPLNPRSTPANKLDSEPEPQPEMIKRVTRVVRISERPNGRPNGLHHEALDSKRTVTYRVDGENHLSRPATHEARVSEPAKRNPENTSLKPQLNVRWEN